MAQVTAYEHIVLNEQEAPIIEGTTLKVVELILEMNAYGWSPQEWQFQHPYLTLGKVHAALAYYWDHAEELDRDIIRRAGKADYIRRAVGPSRLREKLHARGLI